MPEVTAQTVVRQPQETPNDFVLLDYDARFLRRKVLHTETGRHVLVDLPKTTSLEQGDALQTTNGKLIGIRAAAEPLLEVTGQPLHRVAWHIGNRHTPCQIEADRLLIKRDHVMRKMLEGLGAHIHEVIEPFTPEGGAYGLGRTHGHDHSAQHGPDHDHEHTHTHGT